MKLSDLHTQMTSTQLAKLLKKHHNLTVPVQKMSAGQAQHMLESVQSQLGKFRKTTKMHIAEQDQNYVALMLMEQVLQSKVTEGDTWNATKTLISRDVPNAVGKVTSQIPGFNRYTADQVGVRDAVSALQEFWTRLRSAAASKAGMPNRGLSNKQKAQNIMEQLVNRVSEEAKVPSPTVKATLKKYANGDKGKSAPNPVEKKVLEATYKALGKGLNGTLKESAKRKLNESSVADAEVFLAAKDFTDRIQDMVETLGKMLNEELPALIDTIRDVISSEQADSYNTTMTQVLNTALESSRSTKDEVDAAARALAGDESAASAPPTDDAASELPDTGGIDGMDDEENGMAEPPELPTKPEGTNPVGREPR